MSPDKAALVAALLQGLTERAHSLRSLRDAARAGTRVDGGHRPANRGERAAVTSQGYLTAGLGQRLGEVEASIAALSRVPTGPTDRVCAGAFVAVEDEVGERSFFVLPGGSGDLIDGVVVLSPSSPLVRPLLGLQEGDVAELVGGEEVEVLRIR